LQQIRAMATLSLIVRQDQIPIAFGRGDRKAMAKPIDPMAGADPHSSPPARWVCGWTILIVRDSPAPTLTPPARQKPSFFSIFAERKAGRPCRPAGEPVKKAPHVRPPRALRLISTRFPVQQKIVQERTKQFGPSWPKSGPARPAPHRDEVDNGRRTSVRPPPAKSVTSSRQTAPGAPGPKED